MSVLLTERIIRAWYIVGVVVVAVLHLTVRWLELLRGLDEVDDLEKTLEGAPDFARMVICLSSRINFLITGACSSQ